MVRRSKVRSSFAHVGAALAALASVLALGVIQAEPAAAAAPVVERFSPGNINLSVENGGQNQIPNHLYAFAVIRHDAGTTVNGVRFDLVHSTSGGTYTKNGTVNCSTTASITCSGGYKTPGNWSFNSSGFAWTIREAPGQAATTTSTDSTTTWIMVDVTPPNYDSWQNDGPDGTNVCGIEGGTRACQNSASFSFRTSDGQTTADQSFTYWAEAESQSSGTEDYPTAYASSSTAGSTVTAGAADAVTMGYTCDDNDSGAPGSCDSAKLRFRRLNDNATVNPGASSDDLGASKVLSCAAATKVSGDCESRTDNNNYVLGNFNADDNNARQYKYRAPRNRGAYVIEALFCNENGLCPGGPPTGYNDTTSTLGNAGSAWQMIGYFYVNDGAPTVSFGTTTQTGGGTVGTHPTTGALHPNTGTTVTYNLTTSSDTQLVDWNLDQNNTNGINSSGYELRTYGTTSYGGTAASPSPGTISLATDVTQQSRNLSGYGSGVSCTTAVRVYDSGGINASDPSVSSATASKACTTNNVPVGTAQSGINVQRGTSTAINLAATDADRWSAGGNGGDEAPSITITQPAVGTVTCGAFTPATTTTGTFACSYSVPANTAPGAYGYSYTVTDSHNGTSSAVTVTGAILNTAPTATGTTRTIQRGATATFNLNGTDPVNGDTIDGSLSNTGYAVVATTGMPFASSVSCTAAGACTVHTMPGTPPGSYWFTWNVKDNNATSTTATETVTVTNTAPVASAVTVNNVQRGRPASEATFNLSASDTNGDTLGYTVVNSSGLPAGSSLTCSTAGACTVSVPADTAVANYSFTYKANDNNLDSNTATVTVGVGNTTPVANNVGPLHTTVGSPLSVTLDGTDFNGDTLSYAAPVAAPAKGTVTGSGSGRTYQASTGTKGSDSFTYTVSDNAPSTSTAGTVSIVIDNTAPVADAQTTSAPRGVATGITLAGSDANADALTYAVQSTTTKGILTCSTAGSCSYTAGAGQSGDDSFTFVTNDGTANSTAATVTIHITNDAPSASPQSVDAPRRVPTAITLSATDANGDPLTYTGPVSGPSKGSVSCSSAGSCSYTSDAGQTGTDSFTFSVSDGFGGSDTATVSITLTNLAPTADDQSLTAAVHVATPITLTGTDGNGDDLAYALDASPTKGSVTCDAAGSCSYTSDVGATGSDSFTFTVDDGFGGTDSGTVSIGLSNSAPVAAAQSVTAERGIATPITLHGTDPNDDPLTYTAPVTAPTKGSVSCTAASCTYTSDPAATGTDAFTFTVDDGNGETDTATVDITLANSAPAGAPTSITATKALPKQLSLTGTDPNGDSITFAVGQTPTLGSVSCTAGGDCTYTATATSGTDTFTYVVQDQYGAVSDPVTVVVNISLPKLALAEATTIEPDSASMGVYVPVVLSAPLPTDVTVSYYTRDVTATGAVTGGDYRQFGTPAVPRTLRIPAGQTWNAMAPLVNADAVTESDETFEVVVAAVTTGDGSVIPITNGVGTVTIGDASRLSGDPMLTVLGVRQAEGDNADGLTKAQFVLQFSKPVGQSFTLTYRTVDGTATAGAKGTGADYRGISSGSYTVPAGVNVARTIDIPIWGDTVAEGDETLQLQVFVPPGVAVVQNRTVATITLVDDD